MKGHDFNIGLSDSEWKLAAINNASYDYYIHCTKTGIKTPPSSLRICSNHSDKYSGGAPMLKHIAGFKLASGTTAVSLFLESATRWGWFTTAVHVVLSALLPDIFITDEYSDYNDLKRLIFHELGHASHYSVVGENVWGPYIEHIVISKLSGKDCYGDGKKNDAKQRICELGECWGYTSKSLERGFIRTGSNWFAPAITSLYNVINKGYISKACVFSCLKADTKNIDTFFNNLIAKAPAKAKYIEDEFARNKALTNQTVFVLNNDSGCTMIIYYVREGKVKNNYLGTGDSFTLGGLSGFQSSSSSNMESVFDLYDEFSISTYASGYYEERFHIKDGTLLMDFSNSLFNDVLCNSSDDNNPIGNKNTRTHNYEIKDSDL